MTKVAKSLVPPNQPLRRTSAAVALQGVVVRAALAAERHGVGPVAAGQ
jgi:hypothetical protein